MGKTLIDKKVNRTAKRLNKQLKQDVFGDRFQVRQFKKSRGQDGIQYYMYELIDKKQPERNQLVHGWLTGFAITMFHPLDIAMNDFIISSDFWATYKKGE